MVYLHNCEHSESKTANPVCSIPDRTCLFGNHTDADFSFLIDSEQSFTRINKKIRVLLVDEIVLRLTRRDRDFIRIVSVLLAILLYLKTDDLIPSLTIVLLAFLITM